MTHGVRVEPRSAERRDPPQPGLLALGLNLLRFGAALTAVVAALVKESRGSIDPITLEPPVLHRPPAETALTDER